MKERLSFTYHAYHGVLPQLPSTRDRNPSPSRLASPAYLVPLHEPFLTARGRKADGRTLSAKRPKPHNFGPHRFLFLP